MFEFAESVLKEERKTILNEQEEIKEELKSIKSNIEKADNYQNLREFVVFDCITAIFATVGLAYFDCFIYSTFGLESGLFKAMTVFLTVAETRILTFVGLDVKKFIKSVKQGERRYYKSRKLYKEKQKEIGKEQKLCSEKIEEIDIQLNYIHFHNDNYQKPLYQATIAEEYEFLMDEQKKAEAYLEEFLNEPIDYEKIHLEVNQIDEGQPKRLIK